MAEAWHERRRATKADGLSKWGQAAAASKKAGPARASSAEEKET